MKPAEFTEYRRIVALDVLRGIAILGTLLTNIRLFVILRGDEQVSLITPDLTTKLLGLVTDGKFIGLLTLMFGIGLEIQRHSALRKGQPWPGNYYWRAALLILDGLLNFIFIIEIDVLMGYGLTALIVAAIVARKPKTQLMWLWVSLGIHVAILAGLTAVWFAMMNDGQHLGSYMETYTAYEHSSYWADVLFRIQNFFLLRTEIPMIIMSGIPLFLIGCHLYRAGIFEQRGSRLRRRIMIASFGIALPIDWALRLFLHPVSAPLARYFTSACVSVGLIAAVAAFYLNKDQLGRIGRPLSYVGRMALTCYLAQNLIASFIFYDYGLGVAKLIQGPHLTAWMLLIYIGIAAILTLGCAWWLRRHTRGPVEMLWQSSYTWITRATSPQ